MLNNLVFALSQGKTWKTWLYSICCPVLILTIIFGDFKAFSRKKIYLQSSSVLILLLLISHQPSSFWLKWFLFLHIVIVLCNFILFHAPNFRADYWSANWLSLCLSDEELIGAWRKCEKRGLFKTYIDSNFLLQKYPLYITIRFFFLVLYLVVQKS